MDAPNIRQESSRLVKDETYWKGLRTKYFPRLRFANFNQAMISTPLGGHHPDSQDLMNVNQQDSLRLLENEGEEARLGLSKLINSPPNQVYFTVNTTSALRDSLLALSLRPGDFVFTTTEEYGSMQRALDEIGKNGVNIVARPPESLEEAIDRTSGCMNKVLFTSLVTHATCRVLPVKKYSEAAKKKGFLYVVDAAQAVGQIPVDFSEIGADALVGCGHKWLGGKLTSGFLITSAGFPRLGFLDYHSASKPRTQRSGFENDFETFPRVTGWDALSHLGYCLEEYQKLGWPLIFSRIAYLGDFARTELTGVPGIEIINGNPPAPGMVVFRLKIYDQQMVKGKLEGATSIPYAFSLKQEVGGLRLSFWPFASTDEIRGFKQSIINTFGGLG
ncbi:aminotransferase class V-fold PLP-dependent enzyme [Candidatus Woesearchaeota archaeon]|nr:aminotransferase class V-fold PLP-dependent enzyme [Candidatus Woesearchaeota archaeon]